MISTDDTALTKKRLAHIVRMCEGQGGRCNIADMRRAAGVDLADPYAQLLLSRGLMRKEGRNRYVLIAAAMLGKSEDA